MNMEQYRNITLESAMEQARASVWNRHLDMRTFHYCVGQGYHETHWNTLEEAVNDFAWHIKGGFNGVSIHLSAFNPDASEWQVCDADPLCIMD